VRRSPLWSEGRCQDEATAIERRRGSVSEAPGKRSRAAASTFRIEQDVSSDTSTSPDRRARETALESLTLSAAANVPGVDFASITILGKARTLRTIGATDPKAETLDALQYELHEGPCYAAVTEERFVLVHDLAVDGRFPRYAPRAAELGAGSQLAFQLVHNGDRAGLNLYAHGPAAFDQSTVHLAELFGTHAALVLSFAGQVEHLSEALHVRTDIGTAVGVVMERYGISREKAFAFLVRNSNDRNVKVRTLALDIINGTFRSTPDEDARSQLWP
jgi:hypothetical protein